jgi:CheY-like chemotaxis protein
MERKARCLIADDNEMIRHLMQSLLKRLGISYETAVNGSDAIQKSGETAFSLLLLDVNMPQKTGYEVLEEIRKQDKLNIESPAIMLTALENEEKTERFKNSSATAVLQKPFSINELQEILALHLKEDI